MTPAFLILLFLSAITAAAVDDDPPVEEQDTFGTIEAANENITTTLEDGDLVPIVATRNADPCVLTGCKWPKQGSYVYVPVSIDSSDYTRRERNIIIRGLLTFHRSTCIRFHWRRRHRQYIHFFSGDGPDDTLMCRCAPAGTERNFAKKITNNLDTPYDFDSVMQYGK
ncbi:High choriolytic enzyme 2 [Liparis tanakae]|uniref:High choriolytic enzyme 2 n=1 Tax=Liparis tanakae TaxID=230148 RepID=A0A4Z2EPW5_9TELE|nr:High choriolytic enzyme 2 [Liparis tanakae]